MVVGHRQPQLLLKLGEFLGEGVGASGETTVDLALSQVVTLYKTGIDCVADGREGQSRFNGI